MKVNLFTHLLKKREPQKFGDKKKKNYSLLDFKITNQLNKLFQNNKLEQAIQLFEEKKADFEAPTFGFFVKKLGFSKEKGKLEDYFQEMLERFSIIDDQVYKNILISTNANNLWKISIKILDLMKHPDTSDFAPVISVLKNAKEYDYALKIFEKMIEKGMTPTKDIITNIWDILCSKMDSHSADRMMQLMEYLKIRRSSFFDSEKYGILINLLGKFGKLKEIEIVWNEMVERKKTSVENLRTLVKWLEKHEKYDLLENLQLRGRSIIEEHGIQFGDVPKEKTFTGMANLKQFFKDLDKMSESEKSEKSIHLIRRLKYLTAHQFEELLKRYNTSGISVQPDHFVAALHVVSRQKNVCESEIGRFHHLSVVYFFQIPSSIRFSLMKGYAKAGNVEAIRKLMKEQDPQSNRKHNLISNTILLDAFIKRGDLREIEHHFNFMKKTNLVGCHAFSKMIDEMGNLRQTNSIKKLIQEMRELQIPGDSIFYFSVVKAFLKCGEEGEALSWLQKMKGDDIYLPPNALRSLQSQYPRFSSHLQRQERFYIVSSS